MANLIVGLDNLVNSRMVTLQDPLLSKMMLVITSIGSTPCLVVLSLLAAGFLAYKKRWQKTMIFLVGMIGGLVLELSTKAVISRARPGNALLRVDSYSFPSGHATMAFVFFGLMIYLFKDDIKNKAWRAVFIISCAALTLMVGFSRVYFNVHWLSDVIGGFIIGALWLAFTILVTAKGITKERSAKSKPSNQPSKNL